MSITTFESEIYSSLAERHGDIVIFEGQGCSRVTLTFPLSLKAEVGQEVVRVDGSSDLLESSPFIHGACYGTCNELILLNWAGLYLYKWKLSSNDIEIVTPLKRNSDDDRGLYRVNMFVSDSDQLVIVYESGIICLSEIAELSWKHGHNTMDWFPQHLKNNRLLLESADGEQITYRLSDGVAERI